MKIFLDFDNTLAKSDLAVVKCINKLFGMNKTEEDISDYGYKSLGGMVTPKLITQIYESDMFWDIVEIFEDSLKVFRGNEVHICSLGTTKNLSKKTEFLDSLGVKYKKAYVNSDLGYRSIDKSKYNMTGSIQIGDTWQEMKNTNSSFKILFKNYKDYSSMKIPPNKSVYVVNTWDEINDIVDWIGKHGN